MHILGESGGYWLTLFAALLGTRTPALAATAPYPHSPLIEGIAWHTDIHRTDAGGSDLWPTTWAADGHIYTSWGDGAGFGSDFPEEGGRDRVSLGFARIEGFPPDHWLGVNINGGKQAENSASFPKKGKCGGLLSVNGTLYALLNLQDDTWPGVNQALAWSTDKAATWTQASWIWPKGRGNFKAQTFLQSGCDYKGPRDDYVYVYGRNETDWGQGKHGYLARVSRGRIQDRDAYTFFTGIDAAGQARWDSDVGRRQPHFTDPGGVESINVVYNKALNRYILTCHRGDQGTLGIFDGPEPWGPWTTVAYYDNWLGLKGTGKGRNMLYISIPAKWISSDGLMLWFIYTGGLDSFNMVKGTLKLKEKAPPQSSTAIPDWVNFPDEDWKTVTPRQAGLDAQKFNSWVKSRKPRFKKAYAGQKPSSGGVVLTRGGRILHTWGDPDFKYQSASLGKTFTRMALQLAVDKGLIKSATDLVNDYWTGQGQLAPHKVMTMGHNAAVRFLDLQNMTAGFPVSNGWFWHTRDATGMIGPKTIPLWAKFTGDPDYDNYAHVSPGTTSRYSSGGYWRLSQALTAVWKKDLKDVLDEHIMHKIGVPPERWDWLYGEDVRKNRNFYPQMPDYGAYIDPPYEIDGVRVRGGPGWVIMSAKDFARVGLLIATQGVWKDERLISKLGGNRGVAANTVDGWGIVEGKQGYFSFGKVATDFRDPRPEVMASWVVSAPKIKVKTKEQSNRAYEVAVPMRGGVKLTTKIWYSGG